MAFRGQSAVERENQVVKEYVVVPRSSSAPVGVPSPGKAKARATPVMMSDDRLVPDSMTVAKMTEDDVLGRIMRLLGFLIRRRLIIWRFTKRGR